MGKSPAVFPAWVQTLASMAEATGPHFQIAVSCTACRRWRVLDRTALEALAARMGPTFSLINRRTRCRLTAGCAGWNRFHYQSGSMRPLWDDEAIRRWLAE